VEGGPKGAPEGVKDVFAMVMITFSAISFQTLHKYLLVCKVSNCSDGVIYSHEIYAFLEADKFMSIVRFINSYTILYNINPNQNYFSCKYIKRNA